MIDTSEFLGDNLLLYQILETLFSVLKTHFVLSWISTNLQSPSKIKTKMFLLLTIDPPNIISSANVMNLFIIMWRTSKKKLYFCTRLKKSLPFFVQLVPTNTHISVQMLLNVKINLNVLLIFRVNVTVFQERKLWNFLSDIKASTQPTYFILIAFICYRKVPTSMLAL